MIKWKGIDENFNPEGYEGFVYMIINNDTQVKYIGKKTFWSRRSYKVKGRTNRRREVVESNWKVYNSSNKLLKEEIKKNGNDNYSFEIIRLCKSKRELTYYETYYQFKYDVLSSKLNDKYEFLNDQILGKFYRSHIEDK